MTFRWLAGCALLLAACSKTEPAGPDAGPTVVKAVDCSSVSPVALVTTPGNSYSPASVMVPVGGAVKWTLPPQHDVSSSTPGMHIDFGGSVCLQFMAAGTYDYHCSAHGFTGVVIAQ